VLVVESPRREAFHEPRMIGIGLPRTGTSYLAGMVAPPLRAAHEFDAARHTVVAAEYLLGNIGAGHLAGYLAARARVGALDADVSSINAHGAGTLVAMFPDARFVLTVRPPMDWVDAFARHNAWRPGVLRHWRHLRFARLRPDLWPCLPADEPLAARGLGSLDGLLNYWAQHVGTVLAEVPEARLLVVPTCQLDRSVERIRRFLGWPATALRSHPARNGVPDRVRAIPAVSGLIPPRHVAAIVVRHLVGIDWTRLGLPAPSADPA
jgi:hypothetical protein